MLAEITVRYDAPADCVCLVFKYEMEDEEIFILPMPVAQWLTRALAREIHEKAGYRDLYLIEARDLQEGEK